MYLIIENCLCQQYWSSRVENAFISQCVCSNILVLYSNSCRWICSSKIIKSSACLYKYSTWSSLGPLSVDVIHPLAFRLWLFGVVYGITLLVPKTRLSTIGIWAFPIAAARTLNSLPSEVTSSQCLRSFKTEFNTRLFSPLSHSYL